MGFLRTIRGGTSCLPPLHPGCEGSAEWSISCPLGLEDPTWVTRVGLGSVGGQLWDSQGSCVPARPPQPLRQWGATGWLLVPPSPDPNKAATSVFSPLLLLNSLPGEDTPPQMQFPSGLPPQEGPRARVS